MKFIDEQSFISKGEKKIFLYVEKREKPLNSVVNENSFVDSDAKQAIDHFHSHYMANFPLRKGDVLVMNFYSSCGYELRGNHFVAVVNESKARNPLVTVVPLKSMKENKELNPASDVLLGEIEGVLNGKQAIAVINQIRTVDKCRLFDLDVLKRIDDVFNNENKEQYKVKSIQIKNVYRLTNRQYHMLIKAIIEFLDCGYIRH